MLQCSYAASVDVVAWMLQCEIVNAATLECSGLDEWASGHASEPKLNVLNLLLVNTWQPDHLQCQKQHCKMHYNIVATYFVVIVTIVNNGLQ